MQLVNFFRKNFMTVSLFNKQQIFNLYLQERHYAARKGKRAAVLAAKRERKLAEAAKPKTPAAARYMRKATMKPELQKKRFVDENWAESKPVDNVWRTALYRGKPYTFNEVITMYRETHHPSILNLPDAFIYVTAELDVRQKKKDHYLDTVTSVVTFPHEFEIGYTNKVIAICKSEDDQMKASEAGAVFVGSSLLIKRILSGEIMSEDYDYIICHPECYKELNVLRGLLKRNYPTARNGLLRLDVDQAVRSFSKGMKYASTHSAIELDFAWINVCFGRLSMDVNHLEANFSYFLNDLLKQKPQGTNFPFITKTVLWSEHSIERFTVPHAKYLPGYEETTDDLVEHDIEDKNDSVEQEIGAKNIASV